MLNRADRKTGRHRDARSEEPTAPGGENAPSGYPGPRKRARRFLRPSIQLALLTAVVVGALIAVTPADGATGDIRGSFARAMKQLGFSSRAATSGSGTPAVGALFTSSGGKLGSHFCTASVINSPHGDLAITAAHCVTGTSGTIVFAPGYHSGVSPYGTWTVTKIYTDQAWQSSQNPDDDFAFLQLSKSGSSTPIEDVTGAEQLATGTPAAGQTVEVVGYPDSSDEPISCQNSLKEPMANQLEFDCGGYTNGTSGGPFLTHVSSSTGQGTLIGLIGGYEQGGNTPQVSYSAVLGSNTAALYQTAVAGG
jgi:V8-like Glu-specific endopeptidase